MLRQILDRDRLNKMNLIALLCLSGAFLLPSSSGNETKSGEPVDAIRAATALPQIVLLKATFAVPMLECVTGTITALNASARTATYMWKVRGPGGEEEKGIPIDFIIRKDDPSKGVVIINSDTSMPLLGEAIYTDYRNCLIDKYSFGPLEVCMQWVTPGTVNAVPEECSAVMDGKCSGSVLLYKEDACK